jgi:hypothetical protein
VCTTDNFSIIIDKTKFSHLISMGYFQPYLEFYRS